VMFNLLSNAAKFTPDGGAIAVEARRKGKELVISVADTGIGIAPEHQGRIFEEFYQVRGSMRDRVPGTGLGLSLVKQLVDMHGGRVWVESEGEGKGSRFSFSLPIWLTAQNESRIPSKAAQNSLPKRTEKKHGHKAEDTGRGR
jgi:signal transduction histidine kinase